MACHSKMADYRKFCISTYLNYFPKLRGKHNHTRHGVTPHRDDLGSWLKEAEKPDLTSLLQTAAILTKAWAVGLIFFFLVKVNSGQVYSGLFSQS